MQQRAVVGRRRLPGLGRTTILGTSSLVTSGHLVEKFAADGRRFEVFPQVAIDIGIIGAVTGAQYDQTPLRSPAISMSHEGGADLAVPLGSRGSFGPGIEATSSTSSRRLMVTLAFQLEDRLSPLLPPPRDERSDSVATELTANSDVERRALLTAGVNR